MSQPSDEADRLSALGRQLLHNDILRCLIDVIQDSGGLDTLTSLARSCRFLNDAATKALYQSASIRHDDILTLDQISENTPHPLRSHPYLTWADGMAGIEDRRKLLDGKIVISTETFDAVRLGSREPPVFTNNLCKCCSDGSAGRHGTEPEQTLFAQISDKLPRFSTCVINYRAPRADSQVGACFFEEITCFLTQKIAADNYFFKIDPASHRWRSTFLLATPTRDQVEPSEGIPEHFRIYDRMATGSMSVGFVPSLPCGIDEESAMLPRHLEDRGADMAQASRFLYRMLGIELPRSLGTADRTTFIYPPPSCDHRTGADERQTLRAQTSLRFRNLDGSSDEGNKVKFEELNDHPDLQRLLS